jgi:hypothetical protein
MRTLFWYFPPFGASESSEHAVVTEHVENGVDGEIQGEELPRAWRDDSITAVSRGSGTDAVWT